MRDNASGVDLKMDFSFHACQVIYDIRVIKRNHLRRFVIVVLTLISVLLHNVSEGTTIVLVASEKAAAIACDSYQRLSNAGISSERRKKVDKVKDSILVAVGGACAVSGDDGSASIDLQSIVPPIAAELEWDDSGDSAKAFQTRVRKSLGTLEQQRFSGPIDNTIKPQVDVFVAGRSTAGRIFAFRLKYPGKYIQEGDRYRIQFSEVERITYTVNPGKSTFVTLSTDEDIEKRTRDLAAGRLIVPGKYPALGAYRNSACDEQATRGAATDAVQFTIDHDPVIGGTVEVESVPARPQEELPRKSKAHDLKKP